MPLTTTFASFSKDGYSSAGSTNNFSASYVNIISTPNLGLTFNNEIFDSNANTVLSGAINTTGATNKTAIAKTNDTGNITLQIQLASDISANYYDVALQSFFSSADELYSIGRNIDYTGKATGLAVSFDSSLNINWQRQLANVLNQVDVKCGAKSANYLYLGGQFGVSTAFVAAYDLTGAIQFKKSVGNSCVSVFSLATDDSNNYYALAKDNATAGIDGMQIIKWNSSNTYQWDYKITGAADATNGLVIVDPASNVIIGILISSVIYILKFNSSGTLVWQKSLSPSVNALNGLVTDGVGNIYIFATRNYGGGDKSADLIKISADGVIFWQNQILPTSGIFSSGTGTYNRLGWRHGFLILSIQHTTQQQYVIVVPDLGTKKGTYANITYSAISTYSVSTSSLSYASQGNITSALTMTDSAGPLTSSAGTLTQTVSIL